MKKILGSATALGVGFGALPAFAALDLSGAVTEIGAAAAPITAIGTAVIGIAVVMMVFKMVRGML